MLKKIFHLDIDSDRVFGLDILRALAIFFVVATHGASLMPKAIHRTLDNISLDGVSIFFVLSGFLIGGILIRTIEMHAFSGRVMLHFWLRRWFRTLPAYFLVLTMLIGLHFATGNSMHFTDAYPYFFFVQNLASPHPEFFPEAWSLSVEEWFYLLIPLAVFLFGIHTRIRLHTLLLIIAVVVIIAVTAFRLYRHFHLDIDTKEEWAKILVMQVFTRLDSLMYGVLAAVALRYASMQWHRFRIPLFMTGIALAMVWKYIPSISYGLYLNVFSFTLLSIATACVLPFLYSIKSGKGILFRVITYCSIISYSTYLLHLSLIKRLIVNPFPWQFITDNKYVIIAGNNILYWLLTILFSILLYKYFEQPTTRLREKINLIKPLV